MVRVFRTKLVYKNVISSLGVSSKTRDECVKINLEVEMPCKLLTTMAIEIILYEWVVYLKSNMRCH